MGLEAFLRGTDPDAWWSLSGPQQEQLFWEAIDWAESVRSSPSLIDADGSRVGFVEALDLPWRVGTEIPGNVYAVSVDGWSRHLGLLLDPEVAMQIVRDHNFALLARQQAHQQAQQLRPSDDA